MIKPTIGRQVWFRPNAVAAGVMSLHSDQPCAATVIHVWNDRIVNLDVIDHQGQHHVFTRVPLMQDDDEVLPFGKNYAEWMPYQVGQAKAAAAHPVHADIAAMNAPTRQLRAGDVVRLKSGGPDMIVESISGDNALCSWVAGPVCDRSNFHVATLDLVR